ncbi:MAG: 30S ribosomal protein S5 [Patescibacteria group bacterium]|nr:30S ribosomal protein S5 [Patescibacteria group bacterium]
MARNQNKFNNFKNEPREFEETVIQINRVSKKTKGGNRASFSALVVVGDRKGKVGVALGKASDVSSAIRKGFKKAKEEMIQICLKEHTISHEVRIKNGAAKLIFKPAPVGTGIIAGGVIRVIARSAGIKDLVAKIMGTNNKISNAYTTIEAFKRLKN